MSVTVIVLGILLVILLYILYLYLSPSNMSLISTVSLLAKNPPITSIDSPRSPRYAYGLWLYVNTWNNTSEYKYILYRNNNIKLYLDKSQLNLYLDVFMNNNAWLSDNANAGAPILITNNYPIQKWCYIVISVDNMFIDCYLDGKLILSQKTFISTSSGNTSPAQPPDIGNSSGGSNIIVGGYDNGGVGTTPYYVNFDAAINNLMRWSTPVNPQIVWNSYLSGNGSNLNILPKMSSYNAKLNILKNHADYASFSLF